MENQGLLPQAALSCLHTGSVILIWYFFDILILSLKLNQNKKWNVVSSISFTTINQFYLKITSISLGLVQKAVVEKQERIRVRRREEREKDERERLWEMEREREREWERERGERDRERRRWRTVSLTVVESKTKAQRHEINWLLSPNSYRSRSRSGDRYRWLTRECVVYCCNCKAIFKRCFSSLTPKGWSQFLLSSFSTPPLLSLQRRWRARAGSGPRTRPWERQGKREKAPSQGSASLTLALPQAQTKEVWLHFHKIHNFSFSSFPPNSVFFNYEMKRLFCDSWIILKVFPKISVYPCI